MHWFHPLTAQWQLACPNNPDRVGVGLAAFRRLERLEGASRPTAYRVEYECPLCQDAHYALLTGEQLDLEPLHGMSASFLNLHSGQMDWPVEFFGQLWAKSIQQGHWPLRLCCRKQGKWFGGWPSLLQHLEPDGHATPKQLLVQYHCPLCERTDFRQMKVDELQLRALS